MISVAYMEDGWSDINVPFLVKFYNEYGPHHTFEKFTSLAPPLPLLPYLSICTVP